MFEKDLNIGYLLDFYGDVLSERRRGILESYYFEDYSLAEISEELGISRQGVRDAIKKAEEELRFWEAKLGLAARHTALREQARRVAGLMEVASISDELRSEVRLLTELAQGIRPSGSESNARTQTEGPDHVSKLE